MLELIVVVVCLVFNAILSGTEMAFVSAGRPHLKELAKGGNRRAQNLLDMKARPERILSVIQIGITLVGAIAAAVGGAGAEESLSPLLETTLKVSPETAESLSLAIVVIPITLASVVFGELFPKAIALRNPSGIALLMTPFLVLSDKFLSPLINVLENSTNFLLRLCNIHTKPGGDGSGENERPSYAVTFGISRRLSVKEVMVSFKEVITLPHSATVQEVAKIIAECGHTRLPVIKEGRISGILNSKEFSVFKESQLTDWLSIVRGALYFDENTDIMSALKMLQGQRKHMAIVIAQGEPTGVVTIEDILEEFVGDIFDEDDDNLVKQMVRTRTHLRRR